MTKTLPRPISELTTEMGFMLIIGHSGVVSTPTRAAIGRRTEIGQIVDHNGDLFTENGEGAISFIEIPYDETLATTKPAAEVTTALEDLYTNVRSIARDVAPAVGSFRALSTIRLLLADRSAFKDSAEAIGFALIEVSKTIAVSDERNCAAPETISLIQAIFDETDKAIVAQMRAQMARLAVQPPHSPKEHLAIIRRIAASRAIIGNEAALGLLYTHFERTPASTYHPMSVLENRICFVESTVQRATPSNIRKALEDIDAAAREDGIAQAA